METESMGCFCRPERPATSRSWKGLGPTRPEGASQQLHFGLPVSGTWRCPTRAGEAPCLWQPWGTGTCGAHSGSSSPRQPARSPHCCPVGSGGLQCRQRPGAGSPSPRLLCPPHSPLVSSTHTSASGTRRSLCSKSRRLTLALDSHPPVSEEPPEQTPCPLGVGVEAVGHTCPTAHQPPSSAALQPPSPAAPQPCSSPALHLRSPSSRQPYSPAAAQHSPQPLSPAALQPCSHPAQCAADKAQAVISARKAASLPLSSCSCATRSLKLHSSKLQAEEGPWRTEATASPEMTLAAGNALCDVTVNYCWEKGQRPSV